MLVFVVSDGIEAAKSNADAFVETEGWIDLSISRSKEISLDVSGIEDDVLRAAAAAAIDCGVGLVVYTDEI